tara:strand:- start:428 stop:643 length:216 start_codon:yes stop_codon:yes gene_type:complete
VSKGWQKKLFRFSDNDIRRLDLIVEQLGEKLEPQQIKKPNRTLVLRAIIMLASEKDDSELIEFIKDALVYS